MGVLRASGGGLDDLRVGRTEIRLAQGAGPVVSARLAPGQDRGPWTRLLTGGLEASLRTDQGASSFPSLRVIGFEKRPEVRDDAIVTAWFAVGLAIGKPAL